MTLVGGLGRYVGVWERAERVVYPLFCCCQEKVRGRPAQRDIQCRWLVWSNKSRDKDRVNNVSSLGLPCAVSACDWAAVVVSCCLRA